MDDDKLKDYLTKDGARLKAMIALAEDVMKAKRPNELGESYRIFVERVREEWQATEKRDKDNDRRVDKNPQLRNHPALAWLNSFYKAVQQANATSKPAVNSRDLGKIHSAVYEMKSDLSSCLWDFEKKLEELS